jgi:hypothetical protein
MKIRISKSLWDQIHHHLDVTIERAGFLFAKPVESSSNVWQVVDSQLLSENMDYADSSEQHLSLADEVRPLVIKRAHDSETAVIEFHGHYWPGFSTRFSNYDLHGLTEFAPHMLWRLPQRPYFALVIGPQSFDGLVWEVKGNPESLEAIVVGEEELVPTRLSLKNWGKNNGWTL